MAKVLLRGENIRRMRMGRRIPADVLSGTARMILGGPHNKDGPVAMLGSFLLEIILIKIKPPARFGTPGA